MACSLWSTAKWSLSSSTRPTPTCCFCGNFSHRPRSGTSSCRQTSLNLKTGVMKASEVYEIALKVISNYSL
ncbi:hypothetical protein FD754_006983 [Muntiacus muntjak]|uniref:Uncharacterized protein n=1 Tax=Muntiacus muntjak TaxID=9888 RepID=A0A5N3WPI0_MUNMU|nr:hypothetical protein FD754_006983 [Muntiacus muntjak]